MSNKPNSFKKLKEKEIPTPSPIKPEYVNIPDDQWVNLDDVLNSEFKGIYFINKLCQMMNIKTGKVWDINSYTKNVYGYPIFTFITNECRIMCTIHRIVALKFLINDSPLTKIYVDHCDRTKRLSIDNLRWVTPKENNENCIRKSRGESIFYRKYLIDDILYENPIEVIPFYNEKYTLGQLKYISRCINKKDGVCYGYRWERVHENVINYEITYGKAIHRVWNPNHPELGGWKESWEFPRVFVNSNGILKINNTLTLGYLNGGRFTLKFNNGHISSHTLVYETFNNIKIKKPYEIDHLDSNPDHNSIDNLSLKTHKENMNNINTKKKLGKEVSKIDPDTGKILFTYFSVIEGGKSIGVKSYHITQVCSGKRLLCGGYLWAWKGEEEKKWIEFKKYIENGGTMPIGWWTYERCKKEASKYLSRKEFEQRRGAYKASKKNNWLDIFFPGTGRKSYTKWTKELVLEIASKCVDKKDFRINHNDAWQWSQKNGFLKDIPLQKHKHK